MKQFFIIILFLLIGISEGKSQTVGLIQHDAGSLDDGYVLFAPINATTTYLIDKCGRQVKTWNSNYKAGQSAYLLPDGNLFRTGNTNNTNFVAGGQGGIVEKIDWNGNVIWSYKVSDATKCQHHDAKVLPNGNVLILAWESKTKAEAIAQGRTSSQVASTLWSEQILEIEPLGSSGGNIVWEWHLWDHLVQDDDATKPNYAAVASNPQLINLNFATSSASSDWIHMNAIDYNPTLNQILLSAHNMGEIWIIDHSTTTAQAASHSGGNSGKGGDLLWRWGNPQAYDKGTRTDQEFFGQHNAYWIETGLPNANQIMVFNNGLGRTGGNYSTVEIINPPVSGYNYTATLPYLPLSNSWIYNEGNPNNFYANNVSGAQQLSNGNVLMCKGPAGTFTEVTSSGTTVWKYVSPVKATGIASQGSTPGQNLVFRCPFYPKTYSGFNGHTLTSGNPIENSNTLTDACSLVSENENTDTNQTYKIVGTGQSNSYNNSGIIALPTEGQSFYGQNSNHPGNTPIYKDNGDGTVTDLVTGLMWEKTTDKNGDDTINYYDKSTHSEALAGATNCRTGGYTDWRLPTIKEQYSLIMYYGAEANPTATSQGTAVPFINTNYFAFGYGDINSSAHGATSDERLIDAQYATSSIYVSTTMNGAATMFGVNYADGRIKGYPANKVKKYYVQYVRGNTDYGKNNFIDNKNGTLTDNATGLMWMQNDNGSGILWENALKYAEDYTFAGYSDWRLPDVKELQGLLDYTRSPATSNSAAIDPLFNCTKITNEAGVADYPYYMSSTTFSSQTPTDGTDACYVSFGRAMGYMSTLGGWIDVHGAGAQRSDPKTGDQSKFPTGFGPQGDAIRITNYVRLVRDAGTTTSSRFESSMNSIQIFPNPIDHQLTISALSTISKIELLNLDGKTVFAANPNGTKAIVDLSNLPGPKMYLLKIILEENTEPIVRKVMKK
ncbi:MAG: DUF1566 domain-containing protein [Prolixibacteraceae bacterium]